MKKLGKKSLSAMLATSLHIIWWIEWVGYITLIIAAFMVAYIKKAFALNIPVTFSDATLRQLHPVNKDLALGILNTNNGNLYLQVNATWQNIALLLIGFTLIFAVVLIITYQLKVIFTNFKKDVPFNEVNITRIKNIAKVLIAYSVAQWLFVILVNQILISNYRWEHIDLTYSFNIRCLAIGVILMVVAEIFKLGTALENENKLTI